MLDLSTLNIGQRVGIARRGNGTVISEGIYTVSELNDSEVILERIDGLRRQFSVISGKEKSKYGDIDTFIETESDQNHRL